MTPTERALKSRAKMQGQGLIRFEVCLGEGLVDRIRQLAKANGRETWEEVEEALMAHSEKPQARPVTQM